MGNKTPALAKLSQPKLFGVLPRERLFTRLDEVRERPVIWIAAQPGAGKTTLIASYLESRKLPGIWYQIDSGDADPATFFYYLRLAAEGLAGKAGRKHNRLPLLTPEYLPDLPGFARRYFRDLYARLGRPACLVLDNFQEAPEDSPLHQCLPEALAEVPEGIHLIVISRLDPPPQYARFVANRSVALIHWDELRLTSEETRAIALSQQQLDEHDVEQLHHHSSGWAAGLTLLLEHLRRGGNLEALDSAEGLQDVFNYFAGQIFNQASAENQDILLHAGYLPRMAAELLEELSGSPNAGKLLDYLYRRHLFTDRRRSELVREPGSQIIAGKSAPTAYTYQFHALFRAFLRYQAQETFSREQQADVARRAAQLLEDHERPEDAMELYCEAKDWAAVRRVILLEAEQLIGHGRWQAVLEWIGRLPQEQVDADPWLLYWRGTARVAPDIVDARAILERAYQVAVERSDVSCQVQTVSAIMETYFFEYSDLSPLDRWIPIMEQLLASDPPFADVTAELSATTAMLFALGYHQPGHSMLPHVVDRVSTLVTHVEDPNLRIRVYMHLCLYGANLGHRDVSLQVMPQLERLVQHPDVTILSRVMALRAIAWWCAMEPNWTKGMEAVQEMLRLAEANALSYGAKVASSTACVIALMRGRPEEAEHWLSRFEEFANPSGTFDRGALLQHKACLGAIRADVDYAERYAALSVPEADKSGIYYFRAFYRLTLIWVLVERGNIAAARTCIDETRSICTEGRIQWPLPGLCACEAEIARRIGDSMALGEALTAMWAAARETGHTATLNLYYRTWVSRLCAETLRHNIEVEYVRGLIRQYGWQPERPDIDDWPWPIKVYVLGRFALVRDEKPISFTGKTPKKPMALLKAIICFGSDGAAAEPLIDSLWPDAEGDSGHQALKANVARLRDLLQDQEAIEVGGGRIKLHPARVWVDLFAFERLAPPATGEGDNAGRAMQLYRGPLLPEALDEPWTFSARERARGEFTALANGLAARLETDGKWEQAIATYRAGIRADDLIEAFYQGAMRCHLALGQQAEAMSVFRRLKQTLSIKLGIEASPESKRLAEAGRASFTSSVA